MDRGTWRATVHGGAESGTTEGLDLLRLFLRLSGLVQETNLVIAHDPKEG